MQQGPVMSYVLPGVCSGPALDIQMAVCCTIATGGVRSDITCLLYHQLMFIYTRCGKLTSFFELSGLKEKGS
jgi:hypothetical protein